MPNSVENPEHKVPLMYQAQVAGRCQIQRLVPGADEQDAERWVNQWTERTHPQKPIWGSRTQTRTLAFSWRLVTNGGQDDGVIRPVVGANGWPFFPGSSMKGVFRRACTPVQHRRYCGQDLGNGDMAPGILRFLGGYPVDTSWQEGLLDLVHPQQDWQINGGKHSAFIQMSLDRPVIEFALSSSVELSEEEWQTIWEIWDRAAASGLGCRVSAGYGQPQQNGGEVVRSFVIKGQGPASQMLNRDPEFRPNMFKAGLRGHAMRIFGGLTNQATTEMIVQQLFGGITGGDPVVGLIGMRFRSSQEEGEALQLGWHGSGKQAMPYYRVQGRLDWMLNRPSWHDAADPALLKKLMLKLMQFAMIFGGFGKSWRRADHQLFFSDNPDYVRLIGCHWQWLGASRASVGVSKLEDIPKFIRLVQDVAREWMQSQGYRENATHAPWRETWEPQKVQVWGRIATDREDSLAINWLHREYARGQSIKNSNLTGQIGKIGRLWHRMYPVIVFKKDGERRIPVVRPQFLELLTLFSDSSVETQDFLDYLQSRDHQDEMFQRLW